MCLICQNECSSLKTEMYLNMGINNATTSVKEPSPVALLDEQKWIGCHIVNNFCSSCVKACISMIFLNVSTLNVRIYVGSILQTASCKSGYNSEVKERLTYIGGASKLLENIRNYVYTYM